MEMTMKEAMQERHMVRKYLDKPIPADIVETLNDRIRKLNNDHGIEMKLITEDKSAFSTVVRLILAKGVRNYIILAGKEADDLSEKLGYASADIMLFAQTLGLNTWWVGGTFNRGITGDGNKVAINCEGGIFAGANLGLVKYHFEIGAGKENFEWV